LCLAGILECLTLNETFSPMQDMYFFCFLKSLFRFTLTLTTITLLPIMAFPQETEWASRDILSVDQMKGSIDVEQVEVVSASRSTKTLNELPVTVHVVSREEIIRHGYITLADVMKSVPGIKVSQPGSSEEGETFLMRGLKGNYYTKILINNIQNQPSTLGAFPIGAQLPIRQAERIEITYGPSSSVYGADATTGVINIITKNADKGMMAQADVELGEYGYSYLNFMVGGKLGKDRNILQYAIYGSRQDREDMNVVHSDFDLYNPLHTLVFDSATVDFGRGIEYSGEEFFQRPREILNQQGFSEEEFVERAFFPLYRGGLTEPEMNSMPEGSRLLGIQLNYKGWSFGYHDMYRKTFSSIGLSPFFYSYALPLTFIGEHIRRGNLGYTKQLNKVKSTTVISYLQHQADNSSAMPANYNVSTNGISYLYAASDDILAEQILTYTPDKTWEIVAGASFQYSGNLPKTNELAEPFNPRDYRPFSIEKPEPDPRFGDFGYNPLRFSNIAGFGQIYYKKENVSIMAGLRIDRDSRYGATVNPRIAALYKIAENTSVRASFGTSYKAPASSVAYSSLGVAYEDESEFNDYPISPNPNLNPEQFDAYEAGLRHAFTDDIYLDLSVYYNQIEDLITPILEELSGDVFLNARPFTSTRIAKNSGAAKATLFGLQGSLRARNVWPALKMHVDLHINYSEGRETLPEGGGDIDDFREVPEFIGQLRISFSPTDDLFVNLENTMMGGWLRAYTPSAAQAENPIFRVDGYYNLDLVTNYRFNQHFSGFIRVRNMFNAEYAGIAASGLDADLPYNPQYGRNIQAGLRFTME